MRQYVGGMVKGREGAALLQPCWWLSLVLAAPRAGMEAGASLAAPSPGPSPYLPPLLMVEGEKGKVQRMSGWGGRPRRRLFVLGGGENTLKP